MMKMRKIVFLILVVVLCTSCVVFAKSKSNSNAPKTHPVILYPSCTKIDSTGMYNLKFYVKTYENVYGYRYRVYFNGSPIKAGSYSKRQKYTVTEGYTSLELNPKYKGKSLKNKKITIKVDSFNKIRNKRIYSKVEKKTIKVENK